MALENNCQQCQLIDARRSLTEWAGEISKMNDYSTIIRIVDSIFNRKLIDNNITKGVHIDDAVAYEVINLKLIQTGVPIDEIAIKLLEIGASELLYNLIDLVLNRAKLHEIGLMISFLRKNSNELDYLNTRKYLKLLSAVLKNIDQIQSEEAMVRAKVDEIWD